MEERRVDLFVRFAKHALSAVCAAIILLMTACAARADQPLTLDQLIRAALEVNPTVKAARERWYSANHQIKQNYVPVDPLFGYSNIDSPNFPLYESSLHKIVASQSLQCPGKGLLQGDQAKRSAEIARLTYEATIRDVRAQVEVAYYQLALDTALGGVTEALVTSINQVVKVTEIAFATSQVTQSDFIAAELSGAAAEQQL